MIGNVAEIDTFLISGITDKLANQYQKKGKIITKAKSELEIFRKDKLDLETRYEEKELKRLPLYRKILLAIGMKEEEKNYIRT